MLALATLWGALNLSAQNGPAANPTIIDLKQEREAITLVSTVWRFHPGNDLRWAQPSFDDRGWKVLNVGQDWDDQGYREEENQAWFRFTVVIPPNTPGLLMQMPSIHKNYQLFADGRKFGEVGGLPPAPSTATMGAKRVFTLPMTPTSEPQSVTIALRLWQSPDFLPSNRDRFGVVLMGEPDLLLAEFERSKSADFLGNHGLDFTSSVIWTTIAIAGLIFFLLTRRNLYLWIALHGLAVVFLNVELQASRHFAWRLDADLAFVVCGDILSGFCYTMFVAGVLELRKSRWIYLSIALAVAAELSTLLVSAHVPNAWAIAEALFAILMTASQSILLGLLFLGGRKGITEAKVLFVPFALHLAFNTLDNVGYTLPSLKIPFGPLLLRIENIVLLTAPFQVTSRDLVETLMLFAYPAVMVFLFARISHEEQRLSTALKAAREIQNSLVPARRSEYGQLRAEIAYLAAEEVGGDFCQILPGQDGSVLAIVGDVAGKGLKAAMVGSIAVGALRSMAGESVTPAMLLTRLNDVMVRNQEHVFITCLCLEITPAGTITIANAGHLAPYLNGKEMACDSGLPLGLMVGFPYGQVQSTLPDRARVTLISDGVVEAQSKSRELFGFDRTLEISGQTAGEIAGAAQRFGQADDITVLTLDWTASQVHAL